MTFGLIGLTDFPGGTRLAGVGYDGGFFVAPTLIEGVVHGDEISRTELFGPITCLYRIKTFDEAGSEPHMPFGGLRQSGNGWREAGTQALDVYSDLKTIYINHSPLKV